MKETLISLKTAKLAKEKDFNELCLYYYKDNKLYPSYLENGSSTDTDFRVDVEDLYENYNDKYLVGNYYSIPTQTLLQKWIRDAHNIHINCIYSTNKSIIEDYRKGMYFWGIIEFPELDCKVECFNTYEEALEAGLYIGLQLIT